VKRGVLSSGALPIEFPTISLGELFLVPTSLKFRNLMSIDVEEMIRAQPMDAVVLGVVAKIRLVLICIVICRRSGLNYRSKKLT
jgi:dihydroxyacid dehydratase/phosphogluconate dehydratase